MSSVIYEKGIVNRKKQDIKVETQSTNMLQKLFSCVCSSGTDMHASVDK